ncbi:GntT/GntP/DsdX family permease, partial [Escherichia coli]|nr:gluconate transporter [Escherichia coli]GDK55376.1 gluconate transporter [Escherichia coli]CAD6000597.1 gntU_1 [Escherichia coli]
MTTLTLVLTAVGSVLLLLFLVMKARMHAFLALMVVSMGAGLFSGMPLDKIAATMEKGMGSGSSGTLLRRRPLRTERASFPALRSSLYKCFR